MLNQHQIKQAREIVDEFLDKISFGARVEIELVGEQTISVDLEMDEPQVLIGKSGRTLQEVQRLLGIMLRQKIGQPLYVDLDINHYKERKDKYLRRAAQSVAEQVVLTRREHMLKPMSARDRRIVHVELAGYQNVTTESVGEEPKRRVVVKPHI